MNTSRIMCPLCGQSCEQFAPFGVQRVPNRQCPSCGSLERHRLLWTFLKEHTNFMDGSAKRLLHIAPEGILEMLFRQIKGVDYLSADLYDPKAMVRMDITAIPYEAESFDVIYCSHVLEHVQEDRRAMREFKRVLRPEGACIIQVPIYSQPTFEDPSVTSPAERLRLFGQEDHVRKYGFDITERLSESGFIVTEIVAEQLLGNELCERFRIPLSERLYFCT